LKTKIISFGSIHNQLFQFFNEDFTKLTYIFSYFQFPRSSIDHATLFQQINLRTSTQSANKLFRFHYDRSLSKRVLASLPDSSKLGQ